MSDVGILQNIHELSSGPETHPESVGKMTPKESLASVQGWGKPTGWGTPLVVDRHGI